MTPEPQDKPSPRAIRSFIVYSSAGLGMVMEVGVAVWLGWFLGGLLDAKIGTKPWFAIVGVVAMLSASIYHVILVMDRLDRSDSAENGSAPSSSDRAPD